MGWIKMHYFRGLLLVLAAEDIRLEKPDRDSLAERNHVIRRIVF